MQGVEKLRRVPCNAESFWDILFEALCVEGHLYRRSAVISLFCACCFGVFNLIYYVGFKFYTPSKFCEHSIPNSEFLISARHRRRCFVPYSLPFRTPPPHRKL